MNSYFQILGLAMLVVVLGAVLSKQSQDMATLLTLAACVAGAAAALGFLRPVLDFVRTLEGLAGLDGDMVKILLKAVGLGLCGQIAAQICADGGNAALGKTVQLATSGAVLWQALPMLEMLLELIRKVLSEA